MVLLASFSQYLQFCWGLLLSVKQQDHIFQLKKGGMDFWLGVWWRFSWRSWRSWRGLAHEEGKNGAGDQQWDQHSICSTVDWSVVVKRELSQKAELCYQTNDLSLWSGDKRGRYHLSGEIWAMLDYLIYRCIFTSHTQDVVWPFFVGKSLKIYNSDKYRRVFSDFSYRGIVQYTLTASFFLFREQQNQWDSFCQE